MSVDANHEARLAEREIIAEYDEEGIYVYQAFSQEIADQAVKQGTLRVEGFQLDRMSWIKPSFGWMLYRSGYASKSRQERILKIKISHAAFLTILSNARLAGGKTPPNSRSRVRCQWDPDRNLRIGRKSRRAIQLGLKGEILHKYIDEWILSIEDVTSLAKRIKSAIESETELPTVPEEVIYSVPDEIRNRLEMD